LAAGLPLTATGVLATTHVVGTGIAEHVIAGLAARATSSDLTRARETAAYRRRSKRKLDRIAALKYRPFEMAARRAWWT
jgi:hypothetical protein